MLAGILDQLNASSNSLTSFAPVWRQMQCSEAPASSEVREIRFGMTERVAVIDRCRSVAYDAYEL